jgi:O-antigen biosynthesis protein
MKTLIRDWLIKNKDWALVSLLIKNAKSMKKLLAKTRFIIRRLIPEKIRKPISYAVRLRWLMKVTEVKNEKMSPGKPLVSVVTPFYNHGATIQETVDSVLGQTFQDFEYIIVNDGSDKINTDTLHDIKNKKLKIIDHPGNLGKGSPAAARNTGIKEARGRYVICLDADDILDPTYVEKLVIAIETDPGVSMVTTNLRLFGESEGVYDFGSYRPKKMIKENQISTASIFIREAWEDVGGYSAGIGYEDWEYWIKLTEKGFFGKNIHEPLLNYRTAQVSRFIEDQKKHWANIDKIRELHPNFKKNVKKITRERYFHPHIADKESSYINLNNASLYNYPDNSRKNVLIAVPWMTFGGAETLIYNFCREIKEDVNISFVTGLPSKHEWEYKFKEITERVYHLPNLFGNNEDLYLEFISNYIKTRRIEIFHILHTNFPFGILEKLKSRHPELNIVVTMFNDRVRYFEESILYNKHIDLYTSDNNIVGDHYKKRVGNKVRVIPNGIDCDNDFSCKGQHREKIRKELGIKKNELSVFFIGRLSREKKPDTFVSVARGVFKKTDNVKAFIVGDGPMKEEIEDSVAKMDSTKITYLGYQQEVAKYLAAADIFILPSEIEGFPLSILEAMATGTVVIASRVGAVPDVVENGKTGFVVTPSSVEEITKNVLELNKDRELLKKMSELSRKEIENKYSSKVLGDNYIKLYKEVK